jgi:hypothetical protein
LVAVGLLPASDLPSRHLGRAMRADDDEQWRGAAAAAASALTAAAAAAQPAAANHPAAHHPGKGSATPDLLQRPFAALSSGEQSLAEIARLLLEAEGTASCAPLHASTSLSAALRLPACLYACARSVDRPGPLRGAGAGEAVVVIDEFASQLDRDSARRLGRGLTQWLRTRRRRDTGARTLVVAGARAGDVIGDGGLEPNWVFETDSLVLRTLGQPQRAASERAAAAAAAARPAAAAESECVAGAAGAAVAPPPPRPPPLLGCPQEMSSRDHSQSRDHSPLGASLSTMQEEAAAAEKGGGGGEEAGAMASTVAIAVPRLVFQLRRCEPSAWRRYREHHYKTRTLSAAARCFELQLAGADLGGGVRIGGGGEGESFHRVHWVAVPQALRARRVNRRRQRRRRRGGGGGGARGDRAAGLELRVRGHHPADWQRCQLPASASQPSILHAHHAAIERALLSCPRSCCCRGGPSSSTTPCRIDTVHPGIYGGGGDGCQAGPPHRGASGLAGPGVRAHQRPRTLVHQLHQLHQRW